MSTLFLLPSSKLSNTPSSQQNLSADDEYDLRILGCEFIQSSGLLLKLPQTAMATAQVLFHRYYYSKSFVRYSYQHTAMACVVLASKIEEAPKRIRDVIKAFQRLNQLRKNETPTELIINDKYVKLKNEVVKAERRILKELGFCVYVNHPHKFIVSLLNILDSSDNQKFVQTAWSYMNDGLRTDVFLRYSPETIACSCVYLSARILEIPLPELPAWWEIFSVTEEDIRTVCKMILKSYTRPKPDQDRLESIIDKLKKETERTRPSILKQLGKTVESPSSPVSASNDQHHTLKKIKHEATVDDDKLKKINERNHSSRSPKPRSRSRDNQRRKYDIADEDNSRRQYDNRLDEDNSRRRYDNLDEDRDRTRSYVRHYSRSPRRSRSRSRDNQRRKYDNLDEDNSRRRYDRFDEEDRRKKIHERNHSRSPKQSRNRDNSQIKYNKRLYPIDTSSARSSPTLDSSNHYPIKSKIGSIVRDVKLRKKEDIIDEGRRTRVYERNQSRSPKRSRSRSRERKLYNERSNRPPLNISANTNGRKYK